MVNGAVEAPPAIYVPAELAPWPKGDSPEVAGTHTGIREEFKKWFPKVYEAVAMRTGPGSRGYLMAPGSDF